MGISGLTLRLVNRGQWITLERQPQASNPDDSQPTNGGKRAQQSEKQQQATATIIDGPSLAYHICGGYREDNSTNRQAELRPSYSDIGARAVQFLEDMEAVGLPIHAIFFDGVLPSTKLDTRKQRLERTMKQLQEESKQTSTAPTRSPKVRLPDPPFLVPSVLEAIKKSRFGNLVTVVAGEADSFCADEAIAYECSTGKMATIITNDSDLLIHASGKRTRIMLLNGLTRSCPPDPVRIEANVFFPAQLTAAAGVRSLVPAAFFMSDDYHISFDAAIAKAKKTDVENDAKFLQFEKELQKPDYSTSGFSRPVREVLQNMDPRIAELAHQVMPDFPQPPKQPANIFLVPLIEDVSKFSAWISGQGIREVAYSMILSGSRNSRPIAEHSRRGTTVYAQQYKKKPNWRTDLRQYIQILSGVREYLPPKQATAAQRFNYTAMYYVVSALADRCHILSKDELISILTKNYQSREAAHASAMGQAAIYSFRILKQLLALEKAERGLDDELVEMESLLEEMPSLAELFEKGDSDTKEFWGDLAEGILDTIVDED
ncbi:hypothetical protein Q7P37_003448 [Cladosporium fusiforme]